MSPFFVSDFFNLPDTFFPPKSLGCRVHSISGALPSSVPLPPLSAPFRQRGHLPTQSPEPPFTWTSRIRMCHLLLFGLHHYHHHHHSDKKDANMLGSTFTTNTNKGFPNKSCCSFGFFPNEGGGEFPAQIFWHLFISAFLVNKRSLFPPRCQ